MKKIIYISIISALALFSSIQSIAQTTIYSEDFDSSSLPTGWSTYDTFTTSVEWLHSDNHASNPCSDRGVSTSTNSNGYWIVDSDCLGSGSTKENAYLETKSFDFSGYTGVHIKFEHYYKYASGDNASVEYNIGSGWNNITTYTTTTSNPASADLDVSSYVDGESSVKFRFNYYGDWDWYWAIDDFEVTGITAAPMSFTSCTTTQTVTDDIVISSSNEQIIGMQIVTSGSTSPFTASSFTFNTTGSDNVADIANATLYTTGTSSTFATTTQLGDVEVNPSGSYTITGGTNMPYTLSPGTNYFWLTYDIDASASVGHVVDAECTSITVDGTARTPTVTAPNGEREIVDAVYCNNNIGAGTYYIDDFSTTGGISNITNNNTGPDAGGYGDYTSITASALNSASVNYSITTYGSSHIGLWIDWNHDKDFNDADEEIYLNNSSWESSVSSNFTVPAGAAEGPTVMRVVSTYTGDVSACVSHVDAETEDYTFTVVVPTNMSFVSLDASQSNTDDVAIGTVENEILRIEIETDGTNNPFDAENFVFSTNGSDDASGDIENAKLFYTGTSSSFSTGTQIGSDIVSVNGAFTISGSQTLESGINYFWLTYDIKLTGTPTNDVDAQLTSVDINSSTETPCTTSPAGERTIISCASLGTGYSDITLPYSGTGTTVGAVNDFTSGDFNEACGDLSYYHGEDYFYVFTPSSSGDIYVNLRTSSAFQGIVLYEGCPFSYGTCSGYAQSSQGNQSLCASVTAGQTYYLLIDSDGVSAAFDLYISEPSSETLGNTCADADPIISLPYSRTNLSTSCKGDDYDSASDAACSSVYLDSEDYVFVYNVVVPECINIELDNCGSSASVSVYYGCPDDVNSMCIGTAHDSPAPFDADFSLFTAGTYYIIVDSDDTFNESIGFDISISSNGAAQPNDLPCNAIHMDMGSVQTGDNTCTSSYDEPSAPACWTNGNLNTVWYSASVPASGKVNIRTELLSMTNTQIAAYSGTCDNLTLIDCNDDQSSCGDNVYNMSELFLTGLTPSETIYISVDGYQDIIGTFTIGVVDGDVGFTPAHGQDCGIDYAVLICNSTFTVGDPGYQAVGTQCDFGDNLTNNCLNSGERGSAWYLVDVLSNGDFEFVLVPNDYTGIVGSETDYDFAMWKITGSGAVTCADIANNATPDRCNYSHDGVTGLTAGGTASEIGYDSDYDDAFEASLSVHAGDQYLLVISNFTNSESGFYMDLGTSPLDYPGTPTSLTWTGGAGNSDWFNTMNWGNCDVIPDENIDIEISPSSLYQPVIDGLDPGTATNGVLGKNATCKSITINPGANLTINNLYELDIYGDFDNQGTLSSLTGSIIAFKGGNVQIISGNMTGLSAFDILSVEKTGNSITANTELEVNSLFETVDGNSIFDINDMNFYLGGDFNLYSSTTFIGVGSISKFTFNGFSAQEYNTGSGGDLILNDIIINNTLGGVDLSSNLVCSSVGSIEFTSGVINTAANRVECQNIAAESVSTGNTDSYINGNLRNYVSNIVGTYNFPVGTSSFYGLAQVQANNLSGISYLDAVFMSSFLSSGAMDPLFAFDGTMEYQEVATEGIWRINPDAALSGGNYNIVLHFDDGQGYDIEGNPIGNGFEGVLDNKFAPLKRTSGATTAESWVGENCGSIPAENQTGRLLADGYAIRSGITSFSEFGIGKENVTLPVELVEFRAECNGDVVELLWATASELNNDYFTLLRSDDGKIFESIGEVLGQGLSAEYTNYSFIDISSKPEGQYYKMQQTDFDGTKTFSDVIYVECVDKAADFFVFPNPFKDELSISFNEQISREYCIKIYDMLGEIVYDKDVPLNIYQYEIKELRDLKPGTYTLSLISSRNMQNIKLIKM